MPVAIDVSGEVDITVKRTRQFNFNTNLELFSEDKLLLKTSVNTLLPFSKPDIIHQELDDIISFSHDGKMFEWDTNQLKIKHNPLDIISNRFCSIYLNGEKLLDVNRKKLSLIFDTTNLSDKLKLYVTLFLIIYYSDIDSAD